jgi:hypothetical protein
MIVIEIFWLRAKQPREPNAPDDPDRHLMTAAPDHRTTVRPTRRSSTGAGGARSIVVGYNSKKPWRPNHC